MFAAACSVLLSGSIRIQAQYTYMELEDPLAKPGATTPNAICGSTVVGIYSDTNGAAIHGFIYDGNSWRTLDHPSGSVGTFLNGVSGSNIVGNFISGNSRGAFLYNGSEFLPIQDPLALDTMSTFANAVSSGDVVGFFQDSQATHGFLYRNGIYTTLDFPGSANRTVMHGISGNLLTGEYEDGGIVHGFLYDGNLWTSLDFPGAIYTSATSVSGDTVVGNYYNSDTQYHGFIYRAGAYASFDEPSAATGSFVGTLLTGISGSDLVGFYKDTNLVSHGFLAKALPPPKLSIAFSGNTIQVTWPYALTGWTLQQSPDLASPNWTPTGGVSNDGTNNFVQISSPSGQLFFRLARSTFRNDRILSRSKRR